MWIPAHRSHAVNPEKRACLRSATANVRPTIAIFPLSQYQNGFEEGSPLTRRRMRLATYFPPWIATCATPGSNSGDSLLMPNRLRVSAVIAAVSPTAHTFGSPGTDKSGFTRMRPALSISTPSHRPAGEATTPAVHSTVRLAMRSPVDDHAMFVNSLDFRIRVDFDPELLKVVAGLLSESFRVRGQNSRRCLEQ